VTASLFLGLISGTSADGIDAALVSFAGASSQSEHSIARAPPPLPRVGEGRVEGNLESPLEVIAAQTFPYPSDLRDRLIALARSRALVDLDTYGALDVEVGAAFAAAANALLDRANIDRTDVAAIGSHGQTVRHRPDGAHPFTLQIGDASVIAEQTRITTVADFRRADVAAGGQGAPLLPALHAAVFASPRATRVVVNLGGIANITVLSPGRDVLGFDTGPANCLLDAWALRHRGTSRDDGGEWAKSGRVDRNLLAALASDPYFSAKPPKSTGREYFNIDWLDARVGATIAPENVQATLLALTATTVATAIRTSASDVADVFACGGGVYNPALMDALQVELGDAKLASTAALGLDPDYVEAAGFAWLARARMRNEPGNIPSVTGARGPRVLGAIYPPGP
jgi:anhydro-N-acetylmuramic acid kinase